MLLRAGANALLTDELDQTPLHIAASKNRLKLLHRFPELLSPIHNRDILSRTPIHVAICLGYIDFATSLLHFGADPSLPDGYGRNILDWVIGDETLEHQIQKHYPSVVVTPDYTQELAVRQSILQIADTLLQSQLNQPWPLLQQLGRYLLFVGEEDNARCLFELHLSQESFIGTPLYKATCDLCSRLINGPRFVCRICAHMDLCLSCLQKYPCHSRLHPNQEHKTFKVSHVLGRESLLTTTTSEKFRILAEKLSAPNTHGSGKGPPNDSVAYLPSRVTAPKMTARVPMAFLDPSSIFCLILFGLIAFSFRYWYTFM
ncbi:unnamed protein product [Penicillium olsonii]|uniref:Uncharacterized protein n=1 Tax=Penicillium olsonii TaxID=99116 RepID=A0A9W4MXK0_PENOL|nr:unnamed protein product [Penicillium olsonii]